MVAQRKKGFSLYKLLTTLGIAGIFLAVGYFVFQTSYGHLSALQVLITALIFIVSVGCLLCLPWAKWLSEKRYKIVCWVFIGVVALTIVLWFVSAILIYNILINEKVDAEKTLNLLNFLKIVFIISFQTLLANMIARLLLTYKKSLIVFQIVMYLSYLFLDFYVCYALGSIKMASGEVSWTGNTELLTNRLMLTLLTLSILYIAISNAILRVVARRRGLVVGRGLGDAFVDAEEENDRKANPQPKSSEEKLAELKAMLDKQLITQEEYNKKRQEIIDNM